jgi:hypothetical protein
MLQRFLTPWRLKWYSASILFALFVGFTIPILSGSGSIIPTGRLGGDFPTFYSVGRMISKGDWQDLYNRDRQIAEQKPFMGNENAYLPFGYPPHTALIYWPFSILPYRLSYVIHTVIMVLALLLTLHIIRPMSAQLNEHFMCAFTLAVSFFPIFKAIIGGQNTVMTMLLIALSWKAVEQNREYLAGVYIGLMLFKPQFALPLAGVYLLSGRWRIAVSFGVVAILCYAIGTLMIGPDWFAVWLKNAAWQVQAYSMIDKANAVSWLGFAEAVLGVGNQWALITGWVPTVLTVVGISLLWWTGGMKNDSAALIGMTSICLVLIPPHVIFYDAGLLLFACVAIASRPLMLKAELLGMIWFLSWSQTAADFIGFSPLFFITMGTGVLAAHTLVLPALKHVNNE